MATDARPEISYAKSRGLNVAYSVAGDGPLDLVMVPGFVSHLEGALGQPADRPPVRPPGVVCEGDRLRQAGDRPLRSHRRAETLEERMEDLTAVLDAAGVERAALFGISEGA